MSNVSNRKKRSFLIYPKFQLSLLVLNTLVITLLLVGIGVMLNLSYDQLTSEGVTAGLHADHPYFKFVAFQRGLVFRSFSMGLVGAVLISSTLMLVMSHKLAGPIVRLRGHFKAIRAGEPVRELKFRKGDYFGELPAEINGALVRLADEKNKAA